MMSWDKGVESLGTTLDSLSAALLRHHIVSWVLVEAETVTETGQIRRELGRCVNHGELFNV